jgi:hypothetical protein
MRMVLSIKNGSPSFTEISKDMDERVKKMIDVANSNELTVGLHDDAQDYPAEDGEEATSVVMVGAVQQFGTKTVPARPWLTESFDRNEPKLTREMRKILKDFWRDPKIITAELHWLGAMAVDNMKYEVENNSFGFRGNAMSTILAKGRNKPLVDTKHMVSQLDYKVGKGLIK